MLQDRNFQTQINAPKRKRKKAYKASNYMYIYIYIYLTTKGTEAEWIEKAALTDLAGVGNSFARPRLRPFIQEHNLGTVYNVSLDPCYVQKFLYLRHSYYIMVWRSPNLWKINKELKEYMNPSEIISTLFS